MPALAGRVLGDARLAGQAPVLLYRTLQLPPALQEGAVLLGLALRAAMQDGPSLARAGFGGSPLEAGRALFEAMLASPSGVVFAVDEWSAVLDRIATKDGKLHLFLPNLAAALGELAPEHRPDRRPGVPVRAVRGGAPLFHRQHDHARPRVEKKDPEGALRISPEDAMHLGVAAGDTVRLTTRRGSVVTLVDVSASMQRGHVSLPNGMGLTYPASEGGAASRRRRSQRADVDRGPRPLRGHAVAQARARAD